MAASQTRWTGKSDRTSWTDRENWNAGLPRPGVNVLFAGAADRTVDLAKGGKPVNSGALLVQTGTLTLTDGQLVLSPVPAQSGNTFDMVLNKGADVTIAADARVLGKNVAKIGASGTGASLHLLGTMRSEYGIMSGATMEIAGPGGQWIAGESGLDVGGGSTLSIHDGGRFLSAGGFATPNSALQIGDPFGDGSVTVTGRGSNVVAGSVYLGITQGSGTLTIDGGAGVHDFHGIVGSYSDGFATVTGEGSRWINENGLEIGGQPPVASRLTITDHARVSFGNDMQLYGTLALDATTALQGDVIIARGGVIEALAGGKGNVTLTQDIAISYSNWDPDSSRTSYLVADAGTTLRLSGQISGSQEVLRAGAGDIALTHASNTQAATEIYRATLELGADGAAGAGRITFIGGSTPGTLLVDQGVVVANQIIGFEVNDRIDLAGLGFTSGSMGKSWTADADGGTLTLSNGTDHASLVFGDGGFSAASFKLSADDHGGTNVRLT